MTLSGMSNLEQVEDNLNTYIDFKPLSQEEISLIEKVKMEITKTTVVGCTSCRYCCNGCPKGINIPELFKIYNQLLIDGDVNQARQQYHTLVDSHSSSIASECIACGQCENVCPQHIEIIDELKKISRFFDKKS